VDLSVGDLRVGGLSPRATLLDGAADGFEQVAFGLGGCSDAALVSRGVRVMYSANLVSGDLSVPSAAGWYSLCWSLQGGAGTFVSVGPVVLIGIVFEFLCSFAVCGCSCVVCLRVFWGVLAFTSWALALL